MKTTLSIEKLQDRRVLSAWTVNVDDPHDLVPAGVEEQMRAAGNYVMRKLDTHLSWQGTLDLAINVRHNWPEYDGIMPAILQVLPGGVNATIQEMRTGVDPIPSHPDIGTTVHVAYDGTVKVYGMKAYFDPSPDLYVPANVPQGHFDFIGVLDHEVAHGLGFQLGTTDFSRWVTTDRNGYKFFNGPETVRVLGRSLPMSTFGGTHYGNGLLPDNPITTGLMYQWGNYAGNRLDWGRLDFAVLKDLGITVKSVAGLPLVDVIDVNMPRLVLQTTAVNENTPVGSVVTTLNTTRGSGYAFEMVVAQDSAFRIVGNTIVTSKPLDYEIKNNYSITVRMIDGNGVWTHSRLAIRILDLPESTPSLTAPRSIAFNGSLSLEGVRLSGSSTAVSLVVFARTGVLESAVRDSQVQVFSVRNRWGGTTLSMVGAAAAIDRNLRYITYRGNDSSINIQIAANRRNWGSHDIALVRSETPSVARRSAFRALGGTAGPRFDSGKASGVI